MLEADGSIILFESKKEKDSTSQSATIVEEIKRIANENKLNIRGQMWLDELNKCESYDSLSLPDNIEAGKLDIPFAIADDVINQRRLTASFNMVAYRCLAFLGASGTGKTTALQTIAYSVSRIYQPDEVQVLAVSFGGSQMDSLKSIPHIIDVIHGTALHELRQLFYKIESEAERRRQLFATSLVSTLTQYNAEIGNSGDKLPALIVMIDRIGQWYGKLSDDEADKLSDYIKNAAGVGIYFIVTALDQAEIPFALRDSFVKIPLCQHSLGDYSDILGYSLSNKVALPIETAGRGITTFDGSYYEFQTALAFGEMNDAKRSNMLEEYGNALPNQSVKKAVDFVHLPNPIRASDLLKCAPDMGLSQIPIAIKQPDSIPIMLDSYRYPTVFVYGKPSTGKTSLLRALAILRAGEQGKIFVVAKNPEWASLAQKRPNAFVVNPSDDVGDWTDKLEDELIYRNDKRKTYPDYDNPGNARAIALEFEPMCIVLDDVETWYGTGLLEMPKRFMTYLDNAIEKGRRYGISVFAACGTGNTYLLPNEEISKLQSQGCGIALANTLSDYDPWHIELPYNKKYKEMKTGEGFVLFGNRYEMALLPAEVR